MTLAEATFPKDCIVFKQDLFWQSVLDGLPKGFATSKKSAVWEVISNRIYKALASVYLFWDDNGQFYKFIFKGSVYALYFKELYEMFAGSNIAYGSTTHNAITLFDAARRRQKTTILLEVLLQKYDIIEEGLKSEEAGIKISNSEGVTVQLKPKRKRTKDEVEGKLLTTVLLYFREKVVHMITLDNTTIDDSKILDKSKVEHKLFIKDNYTTIDKLKQHLAIKGYKGIQLDTIFKRKSASDNYTTSDSDSASDKKAIATSNNNKTTTSTTTNTQPIITIISNNKETIVVVLITLLLFVLCLFLIKVVLFYVIYLVPL